MYLSIYLSGVSCSKTSQICNICDVDAVTPNVRGTNVHGVYCGLVIVKPRPRPQTFHRSHNNLRTIFIGLHPYFICRLI